MSGPPGASAPWRPRPRLGFWLEGHCFLYVWCTCAGGTRMGEGGGRRRG